MSSVIKTMQVHGIEIEVIGDPLPSAVLGDPSRLSPEAQTKIKAMMGSDTVRFLLKLGLTWATIIGTIAAAAWLENIWFSIAAVFFIGTRQNILGLLVHEQTHRLGIASKAGDHLTNLACAFPLLITLEGYRRVHLAHHRHYFTEHDPDFRRKQGKEWTYPQRVREFIKTIITDLLAMNLVKTLRGKADDGAVDQRPQRGTPAWVRLAFYAALAVVFTLTKTWPLFLLYWLLPLLTVMQVIVRFGAICEHKYNLADPSLAESTPMIEPRWWEMLLLPNLNFNLHIYHHWYPAIPFTRLPAVHRLFKREGLVQSANVFHGYGAYVKHLLTPARNAVASTTMEPKAPRQAA